MKESEIKNIVAQMTLEEKTEFCTGKDFWHLHGIERLGIPEVMVSDGPHGLRKQEGIADHLGLNESKTAICYPAACTLACSFDPELAEKQGKELGKEARSENLSTVLGPAMNIKRSPLCGRNFEYYSEDPLLSGKLAAGMIKGMQSEGVGACPKHFLANNQERYRFTSNSVVDERTMREIYLKNFEIAVTEGKPWTIMGSYNRVNGKYACENKKYLTDILRDEWGFDGYAMTDWGACNDAAAGLEAGMDLVMPGPAEIAAKRMKQAVEEGNISEAVLDRAVERILKIVFRYHEQKRDNTEFMFEQAHDNVRKAACESIVLLKNENQILPLAKDEKVLVIGEYAKIPRFQGGGSSHIRPYKSSGAWEQIKEKGNAEYLDFDADKKELLKAAGNADKVVIFAGVPEEEESEGVDRITMNLPQNQEALIQEVSKVNKETIVVLHNGSAIVMPWIDDVRAVLEVYLGGEAVGLAAADILYGSVNPSGRLAETFPLRLEDTPTYPYYDVENDDVLYREGILVGYRYYSKMKKEVLFPFGYGLSYTTFEYSNLTLDKRKMNDKEQVTVQVKVQNTGTRAGKEVVQLYVAPPSANIVRPDRELRAFQKVSLLPGESKIVKFELDSRAFAYWNETVHDWAVITGEYQIQICANAEKVLLEQSIEVKTTGCKKPLFTINSPIGQMMEYPQAAKILQEMFDAMAETQNTSNGQKENAGLPQAALASFLKEMPLRALLSFEGVFTPRQLEEIIQKINLA